MSENMEPKPINHISLMAWASFSLALFMWGQEAGDIFIALACVGFSMGDGYRNTTGLSVWNGLMAITCLLFAGHHTYKAFSPAPPIGDTVAGQLLAGSLWALCACITIILQLRAMRRGSIETSEKTEE